jgi:Domain of unknown function (DUF4294)
MIQLQKFFLTLLSCLMVLSLSSQTEPDGIQTKIKVNGRIYDAIITTDGDTMILTNLDDANIEVTRSFTNDEEYKKYLQMKSYASKVFPYAKEAIAIHRELEYASKFLSKREKKKKIKELDKRLTEEFEKPLADLTKLQGKILVKMIEKETKVTMYEIIKGVKGGFSAFYWNVFSKLYDYDLKEGYKEGDYPILDAVLVDFDLSYRIENETNLKYIKLDRKKN